MGAGTWEQRRNEELRARRERRIKLLPLLGVLGVCVITAIYVWLHLAEIPFFWTATILIGVFLVLTFLLSYVAKPLVVELLYQLGFQHIDGPKVFDRRPKPKTQPFGVAPRIDADDEHSGSRAA